MSQTRATGTMVNAYQPGQGHLSPAETQMAEDRARLLGPGLPPVLRNPRPPGPGQGVHLYDAQGNAYLDCYNNVASVGHCHPRVVQAMATQAATLASHTRYLHQGVLTLADRLLATMPAEIGHVMFTCTGSEANDLASASPARRPAAPA
jgi:4-aminobutyrate aminotransferase-like enzyme